MYAVEVAEKRMEPVPEFFTDWVLARWMGVTLSTMRDMPFAEVEQARVTMNAIDQAQSNAQQGRQAR